MFGTKLALTTVVTFLSVCCASATASITGTLELRYIDQGANRLVTNQFDLDADGTYDDFNSGSAGAYHLETQNPTGEGLLFPAPEMWAVCIEADQNISGAFELYRVRPLEDGPMGSNWHTGPLTSGQANAFRELWGRFWDPAWTVDGFPDPENDNAAGFGVALKEIVYEPIPNPLDAAAGRYTLSPPDATVSGIANSYLGQLTGDPLYFADLRLLTNNSLQDYIAEVPEPAALVLLGLAGALGMRRRG